MLKDTMYPFNFAHFKEENWTSLGEGQSITLVDIKYAIVYRFHWNDFGIIQWLNNVYQEAYRQSWVSECCLFTIISAVKGR